MMRSGYHILISLSKPDPPAIQPSSSYHYSHSVDAPTVIPSSIFDILPAHSPKLTARRYTFHHSRGEDRAQPEQQDYRFGRLRIDWVDFDITNMSMDAKKSASGKERETHGRGPATATFVPKAPRTKTGSANLPEGVVHIFRDVPRATYAEFTRSSSGATQSTADSSLDTAKRDAVQDSEGVMMGVLAVPSWMTPSDFLAFVAPAAEGMTHLRMIRDSAPNRSVVVIRFKDEAEASEFAEAYNGKQFNAMEAEICHVVRILSVEIDKNDTTSQAISRLGLPQSTIYELPTCPVCLERMDSAVTGLVTVPCSHTFHCTCLSKWGDSRCPVCRYSQTLLSSHPISPNTSRSTVPIPFTPTPNSSQCVDCPPDSPSNTNLWICLICGNIGCGRYRRAHAQAHYERTTHLYALELETQRVWDYAGDGYVHRLIQNKADGKLVELPSAASSMTMSGGRGDGSGPSAADALSAEKIEAIGIEYSYLLTSQLDSQRAYYEAQTTELTVQMSELRSMVDKLTSEVEAGKTRIVEEAERKRWEDEERTAEIERAREKAEKRAERAMELARKMEKEYKDEHALSERLSKNLTVAQERIGEVEKEKSALKGKVAELDDQLRDIMFFVEARSKIESGEGDAAEAVGGSLEISSPPHANASNHRKKGRKR